MKTKVDFDSQEELAKHFIRFQEYYESSEFRGKPFTLGQYREWYSKSKGSFTYYQDWSGFNIPSHVLDTFRLGLFDPLTEEESRILELIPTRTSQFYIIGTYDGGDKEILEHEICHGLYYTSYEYMSKIFKLLAGHLEELKPLRKFLIDLGYHESVLIDECQAYICCNEDYLKKNNISYPNIGKKLRKIKNRYFKV